MHSDTTFVGTLPPPRPPPRIRLIYWRESRANKRLPCPRYERLFRCAAIINCARVPVAPLFVHVESFKRGEFSSSRARRRDGRIHVYFRISFRESKLEFYFRLIGKKLEEPIRLHVRE